MKKNAPLQTITAVVEMNINLEFSKKKALQIAGLFCFVGRAGFEPAKFTQQIYSLPSLAA